MERKKVSQDKYCGITSKGVHKALNFKNITK